LSRSKAINSRRADESPLESLPVSSALWGCFDRMRPERKKPRGRLRGSDEPRNHERGRYWREASQGLICRCARS